MSAICGVVGLDGRPFAAADLAGVMRALGPLGCAQGTWDGTVGRMGVALGACEESPARAKTVGGQPLRSADGALCIAADAVLDCSAELAARLGLPAGTPDARLILSAYARWGERCVDRLSGEFAFALADAGRGGVLIARDQLGVRPLQVHRRRGAVAFATTALSLCALEGVGHELDRERVGEWLALVPETERTFVAGISTLPAGTCAWVDADGLRRRRYWTIDADRIVERGSPAVYAAELREAFERSVERRLPANGSVGVLLSGGLDSTSVAATAARLRPDDPIPTYTAAPPAGWRGPTEPGWDADESGLVRELAAWHPNLRPAFVGGGDRPLLAAHDARFAAGSPPPRNPCNELWTTEAHRRAAEDGVGTLLTGARGNAFFSADDPHWLAALLAQGRLRAVRSELAAMGSPRRAARALAGQLAPPGLRRARGTVSARRAGMTTEDELRFAGAAIGFVVRRHARPAVPFGWRSARRRMLQLAEWSGYIAESAAVRDALMGVRWSDPTSDVRVVAVAATQPPWARRRGERTRAVSRDAMSDRLPPSIVERTRRGAQLPDWLDQLTRRREELVEELEAAREDATCRELLDVGRMERALRAWPDRTRAAERWPLTVRVYRDDLPRALLMSRYVRFFEARRRA